MVTASQSFFPVFARSVVRSVVRSVGRSSFSAGNFTSVCLQLGHFPGRGVPLFTSVGRLSDLILLRTSGSFHQNTLKIIQEPPVPFFKQF